MGGILEMRQQAHKHHVQQSKTGLHTFCSTYLSDILYRQAPASPWSCSLLWVKTWNESLLCRPVDGNNTTLITTCRKEREKLQHKSHVVVITLAWGINLNFSLRTSRTFYCHQSRLRHSQWFINVPWWSHHTGVEWNINIHITCSQSFMSMIRHIKAQLSMTCSHDPSCSIIHIEGQDKCLTHTWCVLTGVVHMVGPWGI